MKTHYTAKELAGKPGMPKTESGVTRWAKRANVPSRKRPGRGGGREYALPSLPAITQEHLARQSLVEVANHPLAKGDGSQQGLVVRSALQPAKTTAQLKAWQRDCMDARLGIMRLIERAAPVVGVNKAIHTIVKAASEGNLPEYAAANLRKGVARSLSYSGVIKWWSSWKKCQDPLVLAPKDVESYQEPAWAEHLLACWRQPQKPGLTDVLAELETMLPTSIKMPSYGQARHYLQKLGAIEKEQGRKTGNELKAIQPFRRRDTSKLYPGVAYTADGHCVDNEVAHPFHGRPFRPEVTPVVDVYSRKAVGWSCDLAESGLAVLDALRMACENWGVPAIFYTDNGSGYKNQMMTAPGTGILNRLNITPHYSRPRNPQGHGLSERAHKTILVKAAKQLCSYIGKPMDGDAKQLAHKVIRKQIKETGKSELLIEWDDFVAHVNRAIEQYNNTPHRGLPAIRDPHTRKRVHQTPNQAWEAGLEQMKRDLPEEQWTLPEPSKETEDLYHPAVERTVIKGEIQFGTLTTGQPKRYYSKDLEEWHGQRVQVAYSPSNAGKVWVRNLETQQLLAVATLGGNSSDYFAESAVEQALVKRGKGRLKRLERKAEEARLEMQGPAQVVVEHPPQIKTEVLRVVNWLETEEARFTEPEVVIPEDPQAALRWWQNMEARVNTGEILSLEEQKKWDNRKNNQIWKAYRAICTEPDLRVVGG